MTANSKPILESKSGSALTLAATSIEGALLITPIVREDDRGHFSRMWCMRELAERGVDFAPVQANVGFSKRKGTVRGMHFQTPPAVEAKLARCTRGALFDVIVDLRPESSSYGRWYGVELTADNGRILYIPERCAHGYQTLEDSTDLLYLTSQYYTSGAATGVRFDDPAFGIKWPLELTAISQQDRRWPLFENERRV